MHILSELRNPLFDPPDRQRALRALQTSRLLKESNTSRAWSVVKTMIDKIVAEQYVTQPTQTGSRFTSPSSCSTPLSKTMATRQVPMYTDSLPPFSYHPTSDPYALPMQRAVSQQQQMPPSDSQFNWDDITLNNSLSNIVGDMPQPSSELPQFDWVSPEKPFDH